MAKLVFILLGALVFESIGVVWLSEGLKQIGEPARISTAEILRLIGHGATNRYILLGVLFETIFFGTLLYLLKNWDVSLIWPLTSLGFVLTTFTAKYIRGEQVTSLRWSGVVLIVIGAALVGYSEKARSPALPTETVAPPAQVSKE